MPFTPPIFLLRGTYAMKLYYADCFDVFPTIDDKSIDLVLCDMPYGTTACKWDTVIDLERMWKELKRIVKDNSAIVLTGSQPFTTILISSNMKQFKYCWVWSKKVGGNWVQAKRMPIKTCEDVIIFGVTSTHPNYYPQMVAVETPRKQGYSMKTTNGGAIPVKRSENYRGARIYSEKYPDTLLTFCPREKGQRGFHPTQKPVALMEYLIKTYSNEGDVVLDFCAGSFTTGVACVNLDREFIGIEKEQHYFEIGKQRIKEAQDAKIS